MSTKYNEEAEDLMFELFDEDDFTKVISFVDKYGCDFVDRDGRNLLMYGAQNETYIEGWEKKTSNLLIYKRLCKI